MLLSGCSFQQECVRGNCINGQGSYNDFNGSIFDGTMYKGGWRDGKRHGQGELLGYGYTYVGQWQNGKKHGQGTMTWTDGQQYVGEFQADKRHGQGTYTYGDGRKYVGEWRDGSENGQGLMTWAGRMIEGEWSQGGSHVKGTMTYSDGNIYEGVLIGRSKHVGFGSQYLFLQHGQGTMTYADGDQDDFTYDMGRVISSTPKPNLTKMIQACMELGFSGDSNIEACVQREAQHIKELAQQREIKQAQSYNTNEKKPLSVMILEGFIDGLANVNWADQRNIAKQKQEIKRLERRQRTSPYIELN